MYLVHPSPKIGLSEEDFSSSAALLGCDVAAVKAVAEVESAGSGFLPDGRIRVLFEGHHFHKYTSGRFDASHPTLSYPKFTTKFYRSGGKEFDRFAEAFSLDPNASVLSASFGRFQIMGFNHRVCGFESPEAMYTSLSGCESEHLKAFCHFILANKLQDSLRNRNWAQFAKKYNGPQFAVNKYDSKLDQAFRKHSVVLL